MMMEHALSYANRGWPVFPVHEMALTGNCVCGDEKGAGKHPYTEHGYKDGSKDAAQIILWWTKWPQANIAIVTGFKSHLIVVDIDAKSGGYNSLSRLERRYQALPVTVKAQSGGGGMHLYFRHPGFEIRGRRGMYPGIDVMADGGQIVAPPSVHKSAVRYQWAENRGPDEALIIELPRWLLGEIQTKRSAKKRVKLRANLWG